MYINFRTTMNIAEKEINNNPIEYRYLRADIERAKSYIKKIIEQNPELDFGDLRLEVIESLYSQAENFSELVDISGKIYEVQALSQLKQRGNVYLNTLYEELKDFEEEPEISTLDNEENIKETVKKLILTSREVKESTKEIQETIREERKKAKKVIHEMRNKKTKNRKISKLLKLNTSK